MFDPYEFFALGSRLLAGTPPESMSRTAIGRAYYACFLTARDKLFGPDGIGLTKRRVKQIKQHAGQNDLGSHEVVIEAVALAPNILLGRAKNLRDQLGQLKALRVQADYKRDPANPRTQSLFTEYGVTDWTGLAHQALALASNLLPDLGRLHTLP